MIELSQDASVPIGGTADPSARAAPGWTEAVSTPAFYRLIAAKRRIVGPLMGISLTYIIGMTLLAGYGKPLLAIKVWGAFNVGYLMILLTYLLCWVVSVIYVTVANETFEALASEVIDGASKGAGA